MPRFSSATHVKNDVDNFSEVYCQKTNSAVINTDCHLNLRKSCQYEFTGFSCFITIAQRKSITETHFRIIVTMERFPKNCFTYI